MTSSPSPVLMILALAALFPGGAALGVALADALAPGSWAAQIVSFFALPAAFALSLKMWFGLALLGAIPRILERLRSPVPSGRETATAVQPGLPGSFVFLPTASGIGALAGIIVGLLSTTTPFWQVAMIYWMTGTMHGAISWQLARKGILVPPESI